MNTAPLLVVVAAVLALAACDGSGPPTPPTSSIPEGIYDLCGPKKTFEHDSGDGSTFIQDHLDGATRARVELVGSAKDEIISFVRPDTEQEKEPLVFGLATFPGEKGTLRGVGTFKHRIEGQPENQLHLVRITKIEGGQNTMPEGCTGKTVLTISFCDLSKDDAGKRDFVCAGDHAHGGDVHVQN